MCMSFKIVKVEGHNSKDRSQAIVH